MPRKNEPGELSSPACSLHEFEPLPGTPHLSWDEVRTWRKARREELIARRVERSAAERQRLTAPIAESLLASVDVKTYPVLGIYWPIRGEIDLREIAHRHVAAGGIVALPVVVKSAAPVEFWRWKPGVALRKGLWNIPVPAERDVLEPQALIVPLVGFDRARFRLGYGGGFYDRTLAAAVPRPHTIGVAYADAELASIHPQPFDIPMDEIITDQFSIKGV